MNREVDGPSQEAAYANAPDLLADPDEGNKKIVREVIAKLDEPEEPLAGVVRPGSEEASLLEKVRAQNAERISRQRAKRYVMLEDEVDENGSVGSRAA